MEKTNKPSRHYASWSDWEDGVMLKLWYESYNLVRVAKALDRTPTAVRMRIDKLKCGKKYGRKCVEPG